MATALWRIFQVILFAAIGHGILEVLDANDVHPDQWVARMINAAITPGSLSGISWILAGCFGLIGAFLWDAFTPRLKTRLGFGPDDGRSGTRKMSPTSFILFGVLGAGICTVIAVTGVIWQHFTAAVTEHPSNSGAQAPAASSAPSSATPSPQVPPKTEISLKRGLEMVDALGAPPGANFGRQPNQSVRDIRWVLLVTSTPENAWLAGLISTLIGRAGITINHLQLPPDRAFKIDAPVMPKSTEQGVVAHGDNLLAHRIINVLSPCFTVKHASKIFDDFPADLRGWYQKQITDDEQSVWIEIGPGSPWREGVTCD